ncbi:MAG: hypothetical protein SOV90_01380 [Lachnospiraceae bacterium]|nr:hypothetical protein [Clostridiales bacterium]MDD6293105.1 hypothetical protein [Eubacteriales bacterium]MDY2606569.1 hypothetical protein [Lachnospiraceae bacterium]
MFIRNATIDDAKEQGRKGLVLTCKQGLVAVVTYYGLSWILLIQCIHLA